jgi:hypothetical protein
VIRIAAVFATIASLAASQDLGLAKPVYLAEDAVACPEMTVAFAYFAGQQRGGKSEGERAVAELFRHPAGDCLRMIKRQQVQVLSANRYYYDIKAPPGQPQNQPWMARLPDLSN